MKKIISIMLLLAMCLGLLAGCGEEPMAALEEAKAYLNTAYIKDSATTAVDYERGNVLKIQIDGVDHEFKVEWSTNNEKVKVVAGEGKMDTITVPYDNFEDLAYILTATISDAEGNSVQVSFDRVVPARAGIVTAVADGTYVIVWENLAYTSLTEDKNYGYNVSNEVTVADGQVSGHKAENVLTIKNVEGTDGFTIQDAYGRYVYMSGNYNSCNVSAELPKEGYVWQLLTNKEGKTYIINALNMKTLAYDTGYTSWGAYPEITDSRKTEIQLIPATAPVACQHVEVVDAAVAATCTETGLTEGKHCELCGEVLVAQETVAATGHVPAAAVQENLVGGGCGEAGSYDEVVKCSVCEAEISRTTVEIPSTGDHNYITELERQEPTCTVDGFVKKACSCGAETTEVLPAAHTPGEAVEENVVPATSSAAGSYDSVVYCTVCNAEVSRETVEIPELEGLYMYIYYADEQKYCTPGAADRNRLKGDTTPFAWLVEIDENGYYIFSADGKYMTSGATGNSMSMEAELTDCARWEVIECANGVYLRNVGANYNGNYNQYLEFYYDFTTYGFNESKANIYTFQLIEVA